MKDKTFKTKAGTELPIMNIKGKDYLQAAPRIFWLREEHPEWSIETNFLQVNESVAVCQATIRDGQGKVIAQGTSMETPKGFESYVEKAETCAISRAASFCGYGTLMAQELEEEGKLAESPINQRNVGSDEQSIKNAPKAKPDGVDATVNKSGSAKNISEAQAKRLFAIANKSGIPMEELKNHIKETYGYESTKDIHYTRYEGICNYAENWRG
jgi:hypothetical protein